MQNILLQYGH